MIPIPVVRIDSVDGHAYEGGTDGGTFQVQLSEAVSGDHRAFN